MDLRALQQPIKDAYRADPDEARITLTARGDGGRRAGRVLHADLGRAIYEAAGPYRRGRRRHGRVLGRPAARRARRLRPADLPDGRHVDGPRGALDRDDGGGRSRPARRRYAGSIARSAPASSALRLRFAVDAPRGVRRRSSMRCCARPSATCGRADSRRRAEDRDRAVGSPPSLRRAALFITEEGSEPAGRGAGG